MIGVVLALLVTAAPEPELRLAVIVGSNSAVAGRGALKYADADARELASVLNLTGGFATTDVITLLEPTPESVLSAVHQAAERARGHRAMFVFYYSGHADDQALYPGGQALQLADLKRALEDPAFAVRVGIIDSCRGGGWTRTKGLRSAATFELAPVALASEGTALLAASSGLEDAHEAESLKGSFFTHHLVAGLRGAADSSGDGRVTLNEAFEYANRLTIRDSAIQSSQPQHPSFDMRLHGRQDVVLADVGGSPSLLTVEQRRGPLQLVQLSSGVVLVEATEGQQVMRVAVPPGGYILRRVAADGVRAREVQVRSGESTTIDEESLTLVGDASLGAKSAEPAPPHRLALGVTTLPDAFIVTLGAQVSYRVTLFDFFGLQVRGAFGGTIPTNLRQQLVRDYQVDTTIILKTTGLVGADGVFMLQPGGGPFRGTASLGASVAFMDPFLFEPRLAMTVGLSAEFQVMRALSVFVEGQLHMLLPFLAVSPVGQVSVGVAWHVG